MNSLRTSDFDNWVPKIIDSIHKTLIHLGADDYFSTAEIKDIYYCLFEQIIDGIGNICPKFSKIRSGLQSGLNLCSFYERKFKTVPKISDSHLYSENLLHTTLLSCLDEKKNKRPVLLFKSKNESTRKAKKDITYIAEQLGILSRIYDYDDFYGLLASQEEVTLMKYTKKDQRLLEEKIWRLDLVKAFKKRKQGFVVRDLVLVLCSILDMVTE